MNAIELIRSDHERFRRLFQDYAKAGPGSDERRQAAQEALPLLNAHARMEEEVFYPAIRAAGDEQGQMRIAESTEEHATQDALVGQLMTMTPGTEQFAAKFHALMTNVQHHMEEEEQETLPLAEQLLGDELDRLGREMAARREQVLAAVR